MSIHQRKDDVEIYEHDRDDIIPKWLHWLFIAINRVGFPIVAFFCIWHYSTVSQNKLSDAMERQSISLETLVIKLDGYHSESKEWRTQMSAELREIRSRVK